MKIKKILAMLLAFAMVLSLVNIGTFAQEVTTYYLSLGGNDSNNGTTAQTPFRTYKKVCQMAKENDVIVKVIGSYKVNYGEYEDHNGTITIEGTDSTTSFATQDGIGVRLSGPVTFKNIKYIQGSNAYLLANGGKLVFDEGFENTQTSQLIALGSVGEVETLNSMELEVKDGVFSNIVVGCVTPSNGCAVLNDANILINGGSVSTLFLGSYGAWSTNKGNTFNKNVVVRLDDGALTKITAQTAFSTVINGALIAVFNNGTQATLDSTLDSITVGSKYYVYSGEGGKVIPVEGEDGNAQAGKFEILFDEGITSAKIINGENVQTVEESGIVTLNQGTTSISYIKEGVEETPVYYLSMGGSDSNNGLTAQTPFRTYKKVCQMAKEKDANVKVIGSYTVVQDDWEAHSGNITIEGISSDATLKSQDKIGFNTSGPVVFKNIKYTSGTDAYMRADGNKLVFGEGFENTASNLITLGGAYDASSFNGMDLEINNGNFTSNIVVGSISSSAGCEFANDANVLVTGGSVNNFFIGSYGNWAGTNKGNTFKKNVVIRVDGGMVSKISAQNYFPTVINGALIAVFNNGTQSAIDSTIDKITVGSKYYVYSGEGGKVIPVKGEDGNAQAGKFELVFDEGTYAANIINGNSIQTIEEDGVITFNQGTTVVEYIKDGDTEGLKYYVNASSGADTNAGISETSPFKTINAAVTRANGRNFTVVIIGSCKLSGSISAHSGIMTITGYDASAKFGLYENAGAWLGGKTVLENIIFENGNNSYYYMNGNDLIIGEGVTAAGYHQMIAGSQGIEVTEKAYVEINSGEFGRVTLGNIATAKENSITGDVRAVVNGGKISKLVIGNDGWMKNSTGHQGATYNSNVLLQVNGGAVENVIYNTTYPAEIEGAIQLIFNDGASPKLSDEFNSYEPTYGKYLIYSGEGGKVDFVFDEGSSLAGVFYLTIPEGMYATVNNDGSIVTVYESGEIELEIGITEISYYDLSSYESAVKVIDGDKEYSYYPMAVIDITTGGTIQLPDNLCTGNKIFAGWYSDAEFKNPIANGSVVSAGKIYAKTIEVAKDVLYVAESDMKVSDKVGLRFKSVISNTLINEISEFNTANEVLNSENKDFNINDGVGYGTVLLPMNIAENDAFVKNGSYVLNETEYKVINVPARKLLDEGESTVSYSAVLTRISDRNLVRNYGARSYITYKDASGCEHTFYSETYSACPYNEAAEMYEENESISTEQKEMLLNEVLIRNDALDNPFANTIRALKYDKKLTVGYLGGSITYGVSAATDGTIRDSYANRTTDWLREEFSDAEIEYVNAGVSDTATNFGVYRLEKTLMNENGHDMPDLVFIEYTSNDWTIGGVNIGQTKTDLLRQIESLVLNIYKLNPYADIVFVFSARGENSCTRPEYIKVAEKYNIPYIDMGIPMQKLMTERGVPNESKTNHYYTQGDDLHPSAKGYAVYFAEIKKTLEKYLINSTVYYPEKQNKEEIKPEPISTNLWTNPQILDVKNFEISGKDITVGDDVKVNMYGTSQDVRSDYSVTNGSLVITGEDNEINFKFTGTTLALIFQMSSYGFNMEITVDGTTKNITTDSAFTNSNYSHTQLFVFNQVLSLKEHTVTIKFKPRNGTVNVKLGGAATAGTVD